MAQTRSNSHLGPHSLNRPDSRHIFFQDNDDDDITISIPLSSFTAFRLIYSNPKQIEKLSKVTFVGPIPDSWLDIRASSFKTMLAKLKFKQNYHTFNGRTSGISSTTIFKDPALVEEDKKIDNDGESMDELTQQQRMQQPNNKFGTFQMKTINFAKSDNKKKISKKHDASKFLGWDERDVKLLGLNHSHGTHGSSISDSDNSTSEEEEEYDDEEEISKDNHQNSESGLRAKTIDFHPHNTFSIFNNSLKNEISKGRRALTIPKRGTSNFKIPTFSNNKNRNIKGKGKGKVSFVSTLDVDDKESEDFSNVSYDNSTVPMSLLPQSREGSPGENTPSSNYIKTHSIPRPFNLKSTNTTDSVPTSFLSFKTAKETFDNEASTSHYRPLVPRSNNTSSSIPNSCMTYNTARESLFDNNLSAPTGTEARSDGLNRKYKGKETDNSESPVSDDTNNTFLVSSSLESISTNTTSTSEPGSDPFTKNLKVQTHIDVINPLQRDESISKIVSQVDTLSTTYPDIINDKSTIHKLEPKDHDRLRTVHKLQTMAKKTISHTKGMTTSIVRGHLMKKKPGKIIKIEKMLVTIKTSKQKNILNFNEVECCDTRTEQRSREYTVIARSTGEFDSPIILQFRSKRNIPLIDKEKNGSSKKSIKDKLSSVLNSNSNSLDLRLSRNVCANFYSTLDKSIVLWKNVKDPPTKKHLSSNHIHTINNNVKMKKIKKEVEKKNANNDNYNNDQYGSIFYILQCKTQSNAVLWFSFFQECLGISSNKNFSLKIPDLDLSCDVKFPKNLYSKLTKNGLNDDDSNNMLVLNYNNSKYGYDYHYNFPIVTYIIDNVLRKVCSIDEEHALFIKTWRENNEKLALDWRRYDRVEWIFGNNQKLLFGKWSMNMTHDLEIRPLKHYPDDIKIPVDNVSGGTSTIMEEPSPIEGYLTRIITTVDGELYKSKFNNCKVMSNDLYFTTCDNLLFFCETEFATPPINDLSMFDLNGLINDVTRARKFIKSMPIINEICPFRTDENGRFEALPVHSFNQVCFKKFDRDALLEFDRRVGTIVRAKGFIDLKLILNIKPVNVTDERFQNSQLQLILVNNNFKSNVKINIDGLFEIFLKNGTTILLQAFSKEARDEWIFRLNKISRYWVLRFQEDVTRMKMIRQSNIKTLNIDGIKEAKIGESMSRWEVSRGIADPTSFNITGIAMSRTILMKGVLHQKPKKHSTFRGYYAILCPGFLILYKLYRRDLFGVATSQPDYRHHLTIPLSGCYIYSGTQTFCNLLQRDLTFDKMNPGNHPLARVYEDGWKSSEEEEQRCFILWFGKKRDLSNSHINKTQESSMKNSNTLFEAVKPPSDIVQNPSCLRMFGRLGATGHSMVFMARSRQEKDLWVTSLFSALERFSVSGTEGINIV